MTYGRFEELPVWKAPVAWGHGVYTLVEDRVFNTTGDLRDQLQRSSLSVSNNIAEGFERGTTAELRRAPRNSSRQPFSSAGKIEQTCSAAGYEPPTTCTPYE